MDLTKDAIQLLMDAGARAQLMGGDPFLVVPPQHQLKNMAEFVPPTRIRTTVRLDTPDAFITYVNRFKDDDTLIFGAVTDTGAKFAAVLDYHLAPKVFATASDKGVTVQDRTSAAPRYLSHLAMFDCQTTTEWQRWMKQDGVRMSQADFATWLEDNQDLFENPSGAELLELVLSLEGKAEVRFNSSIRLSSGKNALVYDEDVALVGNAGSSKPGKIEVPQMLTARICPFQGTPGERVNARLKYRIEGRKLTFWFETVTPHRSVRDAVQAMLQSVTDETGIVPLLGDVWP